MKFAWLVGRNHHCRYGIHGFRNIDPFFYTAMCQRVARNSKNSARVILESITSFPVWIGLNFNVRIIYTEALQNAVQFILMRLFKFNATNNNPSSAKSLPTSRTPASAINRSSKP